MSKPTLEAWLEGRRGDAGELVAGLGRLAAASARGGWSTPVCPGAKLGAIEPAPGSYVKVRFDQA